MSDPRKETQEFEAVLTVRWSTEIFDEDPDDVYELAKLERPYLVDATFGLAHDLGAKVEITKFGPVID